MPTCIVILLFLPTDRATEEDPKIGAEKRDGSYDPNQLNVIHDIGSLFVFHILFTYRQMLLI